VNAVGPTQPVQHAPPPVPPAHAPNGLRARLARLARDPNAIWMREMRQSARLARTPWILFGLTLSISLLMCAIGGIAASEHASPAQLGGALFQVFFSLAYLVVVIVGPAVAANSIASEREGKTWEAVLLTGLSPKEIARGKFLAGYTTIALYIVILAPVGALSFLFGGVTAAEVIVAFAFLFLLAGLAVAFGLAVSSLMSSLRAALVVTLMLAICIGPMVYLTFGVGGSIAIHQQWSDVPDGLPVWLPIAYSRASFGLTYVLFLCVLPLLLVVVPAWFLYEVTIANLTGEAEDRSTGLKRWYAVCTPLLAAACTVPTLLASRDPDRVGFAGVGLLAFAGHIAFSSMLFLHEPPGPSRRVRIHWARARAGVLRRFFGPGLTKTSILLMLLGLLGVAGITAAAMAGIEVWGTSTDKRAKMAQIFVAGAYGAGFFVFVVGLNAWLRARGSSPWIARLIASGVLFLIATGPFVVAAIGGVMDHRNDLEWIVVGAPSPLYALVMMNALNTATNQTLTLAAGLACIAGWTLLGLALLAAAARRCARAVSQHDGAIAQAEAALDAEEAAHRAATAQPSPPLAPPLAPPPAR
jgi:ABC-type transport system involved in multi-copper enzyme maturation permease subunit